MADELRSILFSGFQSSGLKRTRLSPDSNQQEGDFSSSGKSSPLGLRLSKTASLVNLLEQKLSQARTSPDETHNAALLCNTSQAKKDDLEKEKLKATNFHALLLKIGSWERISRHEGDLVAKCYYGKKKIVWEVLDGALKNKIEVQWSDIVAIKATIADDQPGILELELNQPPQFFRETNPQPRKHTLWQPGPDFTGGQAPTFRRHYVRFPPGTLEKHYEKLLQCDHRLLELSRRPFPRLESPYFYSNLYSGTNISFDFRAPLSQVPFLGMQHGFPQMPSSYSQVPPHLIQNQGYTVGIMDSYSPMSVMDFPQTSDNVNSYTFEDPRAAQWGSVGNYGEYSCAGKDHNIQEMQPYIPAAPCYEGAFSCPIPNYWEEAARSCGSSSLMLNDIESHLLGDSVVSCSDDGRPMLEPQKLSNFSQNIGANHGAYGQASYVQDNGIPYVQPVHDMPPQVFSGTSMMSYLPTENKTYGFSNPAAGEKEVFDASHEERRFPSGKSSPLGLRLSKTQSLANLLEQKLTQARTSPDETHNVASLRNTSQAKNVDLKKEKLKATNFPALLLKIGSWERISRHEGDLVAKCYYGKKKIVWEVLDGALKSKIEVQWSDIGAIKATIADDQPGILEIELNQPPQFFRETNPQPRKHTLCQPGPNFTGGQAPTFRRHYVRFPSGTLEKHYEKLLQCDHRLLELSRRPFPLLESPYFYSNLYSGTNISFDFRAPLSQVPFPGMQYVFSQIPSCYSQVPPHLIQTQVYAVGIMDSYSPVSDPRAAQWGSKGNYGEYSLAGKDYIQEMQPYIPAAPCYEGAFSCPIPDYWEEAARSCGSSSLMLNDIECHLLGDSMVSCSDEGKLVLEPQKLSNFSQNIGANHGAYGQASYVEDMGINERLDMDYAIPYVQPVHAMPPQVFSGTSMMSCLPTENKTYGFSNPAAGEKEVFYASHEVWR